MNRNPVKSSNISSIGYDDETRELHIEFKGGGVYAYDEVPPELVAKLIGSESVGKFFHANVKDQFKTRKLK